VVTIPEALQVGDASASENADADRVMQDVRHDSARVPRPGAPCPPSNSGYGP
jgi:hypothetical protein